MNYSKESRNANKHSPSFLPDVEDNEIMYIESRSRIESQGNVKVSNTKNTINTLTCLLDSYRSSTNKRCASGHRKNSLSSWENDAASFYSSYSYDALGMKQVKYICWLYKKINENDGSAMLGCRLCEQYRM
ncbi:unnamed protein product, partial [Rotaria sp. Silwood2]